MKLKLPAKSFSQTFRYASALLCAKCLAFMSLSTLADELKKPIKVASYLTPGLITQDGSGMFNQLNKAIFNEMDSTAQLTISSMERAKQSITTGQAEVYFPELWENLSTDQSKYVVSSPIFYKRIVLFTHKDANIKTLEDLDSGLLGVVTGYSYGNKIKSNKQLNLIYQSDDITNIKLLLNKRISGVLGGFPGTVLAVKQHDTANAIHYDLKKPVAVLESFYVCKNDQAGIRLCNAINKAIKSLQRKGILQLNAATGYSKFTPQTAH